MHALRRSLQSALSTTSLVQCRQDPKHRLGTKCELLVLCCCIESCWVAGPVFEVGSECVFFFIFASFICSACLSLMLSSNMFSLLFDALLLTCCCKCCLFARSGIQTGMVMSQTHKYRFHEALKGGMLNVIILSPILYLEMAVT